jgi:putative peptidoglycan lipid II flippase
VTGSISYLYYANRIFQLPLALFAIATSIALFPRIARFLKNKDEAKALAFLEKAFWFLAFLLIGSTVGGYMLAHEITWALFERGAFSTEDTYNTTAVLQMYMIGLIPFGLQKLFVLWLYAQEMQMRAAKIATFSLAAYIILALSLISPMGVSGLALASTMSGFVSFILTIRVFGTAQFFKMLKSVKSLYLILLTSLLIIILLFLKEYLKQFII